LANLSIKKGLFAGWASQVEEHLAYLREDSMRIGIDARMYGSAQGGLGRYIEQLLIHLEKQLTDEEMVVFFTSRQF
jgi:hypothetical protein